MSLISHHAATPTSKQAPPSSRELTIAPTSFAQQRLWLIDQFMEEEKYTYNIPIAIQFEGGLNPTVLEQTLKEIVRRHDTLRTTFSDDNGQPVQVIAPTLALTLPLVDLSHLSPDEQQATASQLMLQEARHLFNLQQGPLFRSLLLRLGPEKHILVIVIHHIIADGWSIGILKHELTTLYAAFAAGRPSPLPELPLQYAGFAAWQREWLSGPALDEQLTYWRERLSDNPAPLELPVDYPRPLKQTFRGGRCNLTIPQTLVEPLKTLSRQQKVTLFMTLTAAFKVLLYRYTNQVDLLIGTPIANRRRVEIEPLIGFFVNTLVLRTDLSGNPSFQELLERVRQVALEAYTHQDLPFEKLVAELQTGRDLSRSPFFQVVFVLQNAPSPVTELPGLSLKLDSLANGSAKFDLLLNLTETEAGLEGYFEYNTGLFKASTIERMAGHLQTLLAGIVDRPATPIAQLPLLTPAERHQILVEWNDTWTDYPADQGIQQLFEAQAEQTPERTALVFEDTHLTYRQLNERANQLAHYLLTLGVKPGDFIGLCLERSLEMIIGTLAILKAGGAYVPLDPAYPAERLAFMLADTQTPVLLTQQSLVGQLPSGQAQLVCLDTGWETIARQPRTNLERQANSANLAYVMYTSGSTGRPKGVSVTHRNVVRLVKATNYAQLTADEIFLQFAPVSFDAATLEIWGALLNGGRLVIFPAQLPSLEMLGEIIERYQITTLWLTAGLFHQMVDHHLDKLRGVRQLLAGGDVLSPPHVRRVLQELPGCRLINGYGPTENTTFTTCYPIQPGEPIETSVPIGRPIANSQVYILDEFLQPVPVGVPGELYAGGDGVAQGYLNRPELTAERFIANPFMAISRGAEEQPFQEAPNRSRGEGAPPLLRPPAPPLLYKTGDLARYRPDGNIEFLGRIDHQVKIRGFRIELGEIETVLGQHPAIKNCVVVALAGQAATDKRLVAYLILNKGQPATINDLRIFLEERLPDYMVPAAFVPLESFPLDPNGKVNRRALPPPTSTGLELGVDFVAPEGPIEQMLAEIWQEVLGVERVGLNDSFFHLGGHSLLAARVISRLRQEYDLEIPLRRLFELPTIAQLAPIIEEMVLSDIDE